MTGLIIIFIIFLSVIAIACLGFGILAIISGDIDVGIFLSFLTFMVVMTIYGIVDEERNVEKFGYNSTVVKVMNNDPSIQIDTIALDKDGKIREVKIKQLR